MTGVAVTGLGVVAPFGAGREALAAALLGAGDGASTASTNGAAGAPGPRLLADFDVRAQLGRKGTSFLNRCTAMALVACREALADSGLTGEVGREARIGVSLGTTSGSLRSMWEYTLETLVEERPYLVNPALFPNTVMNCASGQVAIRHGLGGINATIAGGPIAFFGVLKCAMRGLALGYLDATLAGSVEEFSEQRDLQSRLARVNGSGPASGEGAAVLVLERAGDARAGRHCDAEIESLQSGFCPGGESGGGLAAALERTARAALAAAGASGPEVALAAACVPADTATPDLARDVVGRLEGRPEWLELTPLTGECGAAASALHVAGLLTRHREDPGRDGQRSLVLGWSADGGVAAAVLRGYSREGALR